MIQRHGRPGTPARRTREPSGDLDLGPGKDGIPAAKGHARHVRAGRIVAGARDHAPGGRGRRILAAAQAAAARRCAEDWVAAPTAAGPIADMPAARAG